LPHFRFIRRLRWPPFRFQALMRRLSIRRLPLLPTFSPLTLRHFDFAIDDIAIFIFIFILIVISRDYAIAFALISHAIAAIDAATPLFLHAISRQMLARLHCQPPH
jgi:hypothetical protein